MLKVHNCQYQHPEPVPDHQQQQIQTMQVAVLNIKGEATGRTVELPEEIFGIEPHEHSVWLDVKRYLAAQRQGTHKSKERSEISGSTRKLHKHCLLYTSDAADE